MTPSTATRRLVKSPPELWAELSSEDSLGRHLAEFGEIRITRVRPQTTVAWEGDRASGTVELTPTGWGTKVMLTATAAPAAPAPPAAPEQAASTAAPAQPQRAAPSPAEEPRGLLARLFRRRPTPTADADPPRPVPASSDADPLRPVPASSDAEPLRPVPASSLAAAPVPTPPSTPPLEDLDADRTAAILCEVLDDLGAAHHRPFSRD